jgi:hypothetical protein
MGAARTATTLLTPIMLRAMRHRVPRWILFAA